MYPDYVEWLKPNANSLFIDGSSSLCYCCGMRASSALALFSALLLGCPSHGEPVTELSRTDLRQLLESGAAEDPRRAISTAQGQASGEILDIRAFQGSALYYRVLVKKPDGQVVSIVINANSGSLLEPSSLLASSVNAAASRVDSSAGAAAPSTTGAAAAAGGAKSNGSASAESSGNAGGNSGGNGNSAGNGKSGGNSNSGGNGNAGGNGNGHGK
jgi:hypothetical protein